MGRRKRIDWDWELARSEYPNVRAEIDAFEHMWWSQLLTPTEVGLEWDRMTLLLLQGEYDTVLREYPFVQKIKRGAHRHNRVPIPRSYRTAVLAIGYCEACGSTEKLHVDHIQPVSRGGTNEIENLQCLCRDCNLSKSAKTMDEWRAARGN